MFGPGPNPEAEIPNPKATAWLSALETYTSQTVAKRQSQARTFNPKTQLSCKVGVCSFGCVKGFRVVGLFSSGFTV